MAFPAPQAASLAQKDPSLHRACGRTGLLAPGRLLFSEDEPARIDASTGDGGLNIWRASSDL